MSKRRSMDFREEVSDKKDARRNEETEIFRQLGSGARRVEKFWIDLLKTNWTNVNSMCNNISRTISRQNNDILGKSLSSHAINKLNAAKETK